ncbi:MAG: galactarate dehydratase [Verrucomicrobia bacterium]|nr:MAG: galactarate dehydratase [Verrucomicrobiota bacterium]
MSQTTPAQPFYIRMHASDNVAIVVNDGGLPAGAEFPGEFVLNQHVPQGHKVALRELAAGESIVRYGVTIGHATRAIRRGDWVEEALVRLPPAQDLAGLPVCTVKEENPGPLEGYTFEGYRNEDGTVGTRNILAITTTVQCVAGVVEHAVKRIKMELLPQYPGVDDVIALEHTYGCGVAIDAPEADIPIRTLRNISLNPNFGGQALVVSLGCEKLQPARLLPPGTLPVPTSSCLVCLQDERHVGFESMITSILEMAAKTLAVLGQRRRVTCPVSDLVVGLQCGGSDAFSGVTANPAVGFASDLLVRAGASVLFSETTEVRDAISQLTARAANPEVAADLIREMAWYDRYLERGGVDRSANTTPGNKKGGLVNIVEKAMGSVVKSGTGTISGVLGPGEKLRSKGLIYAATPASDFICGTLQMAAGMNLHVFTTGRGTPYGLAAVPVLKVATRSDLARRWHDLMDLNAGTIATGESTIADVGWELFHLLLAVASGKKTWAEHWKLHNALTLFNPAPVT